MSRQTAMIIGAIVAVVLIAVVGGVLFVSSQQGVLVGSAAAPTFAPPPTVRVALTAAPAAPSSPEPAPGGPELAPGSPEAPSNSPQTTTLPSVTPAVSETSLALAAPTLAPTPKVAAPLTPARLSASGNAPNSEDGQGNVTTFVAANAADGMPETAWRIAGDGVNQWLLVEFAGPVDLQELRILPGYAKIDEQDGTNRLSVTKNCGAASGCGIGTSRR